MLTEVVTVVKNGGALTCMLIDGHSEIQCLEKGLSQLESKASIQLSEKSVFLAIQERTEDISKKLLVLQRHLIELSINTDESKVSRRFHGSTAGEYSVADPKSNVLSVIYHLTDEIIDLGVRIKSCLTSHSSQIMDPIYPDSDVTDSEDRDDNDSGLQLIKPNFHVVIVKKNSKKGNN